MPKQKQVYRPSELAAPHRGRAPGKLKRSIAVVTYLNEHEKAALLYACEKTGLSMSELFRRWIYQTLDDFDLALVPRKS